MERLRTLTAFALAAGMLTLGGGCLTPDATKTQVKKPDVTQPGVLPPPQEIMKGGPASQPSGVVQAGGVQQPQPTARAPAASALAVSSLSKVKTMFENKTPASDMAVTWQPRIAYLPDPSQNGKPGPGIVGQVFLFGGRHLNFIEADGTLTVDLLDETPHLAGQPAATPERWQFNKETLLKLRARDETFGESYVLFLPWPAYRPDITKVRISARYDPANGQTLFSTPTVLTIDKTPYGTTIWSKPSETTSNTTERRGTSNVMMNPPSEPSSGFNLNGAIPIGGSSPPSSIGAPSSSVPIGPVAPSGPNASSVAPPLPPIVTTLGR